MFDKKKKETTKPSVGIEDMEGFHKCILNIEIRHSPGHSAMGKSHPHPPKRDIHPLFSSITVSKGVLWRLATRALVGEKLMKYYKREK